MTLLTAFPPGGSSSVKLITIKINLEKAKLKRFIIDVYNEKEKK